MLAIIIIAISLRLINLGNESLWYDEAFSLGISKFPVEKIISSTSQDVHPPFYYILLHYWINVFGDNDFALKLMSIFFSIISIIVVYIFVQRIYNFRVAVIASLLLSFSRLDIYYSREVRMYTLIALLTLISMICLYFYFEKKKKSYLLIFAISTTLNLYTHNFALFVFVAQFLLSVFYIVAISFKSNKNLPDNQSTTENTNGFLNDLISRDLINLSVAFISIIILFLPWIKVASNQFEIVRYDFWIPETTILAFGEIFIEFSGSLYLSLIFLLSYITYLIYNKRIKLSSITNLPNSLFIIWLVVPVSLPIIFSLTHITASIFKIRYLLPSLIPFVIIASLVLERILTKSKKTFIMIFGLILIFSIQIYIYENPKKFKERWREISTFIDDNFQKNDVVIFDVGNEFDKIGGCFTLTQHYLNNDFEYYYINNQKSIELLSKNIDRINNIFYIQRPPKPINNLLKNLTIEKYVSKDFPELRNFSIRYFFISNYENDNRDIFLEKRTESVPIKLIRFERTKAKQNK